ncbi:hypothetical protein FDECE_898 [Fusarium decemcellulare]|nr:hypothetical protein FDECE_898 [Fusarium decemcellulare]
MAGPPPREPQQRYEPRRKRRQVGRACDGCRLQRIKCDDNSPCLNCRSRGRPCSNSSTTKPSTLPQAHEEIRRLQSRVHELEAEVERLRTPVASNHVSPTSEQSATPSQHGEASQDRKIKCWNGIQLRPARSPHSAWFGPSSLYYFTHRLSNFLSAQSDHMLIHLTSNLELADRPAAPQDSSNLLAPLGEAANNNAVYLGPVQEEYFLNLFWQTYHTSLFAILNEAAFKKDYQALYVDVPAGQPRRSSALVDIVVAMCMQYGTSTLPSGHQGSIVEDNDATIAGRWHYRRAKALLACEMESPTISTLQCQLLCVIYVCGGSFHNMADSICGLAVRTAYMLGLHLDPSPGMPEPERQVRRRLWWAVYVLDTKVGMKLGRPFLIHDSQVMPDLPSDTLDASIHSGSTFAPIGDNATWLSFNLHHIKLYKTLRSVHSAFYNYDHGFGTEKTISYNPSHLEELAKTWGPSTKSIEEWVSEVPNALKTQRQDQGCSLSTDGSALNVEQYAPLWLQRQRILLELEYHHMSVNIYRPFITFSVEPQSSLVQQMAAKSAAHAIELTKITQQALSLTSLLDGWHEAFQWQWNAGMTLAGFVLANPQSPSTPAARSTVELAVSVLDTFGASFGTGAKAAAIVRALCPPVQSTISDIESGTIELLGAEYPDMGQEALTQDFLLDGNTTDLGTIGGPTFDLMDMAVDVDFWADMGML